MLRLRSITLGTLALALLATLALPSRASAADDRYRAQARLFGPTALKGKARYEERPKNGSLMRKFKVELQQGVPGTTHSVFVKGAQVGSITLNALGRGKFELRTPQHIDDPGDGDPMPPGFPRLTTGDLVNAGPLSGVIFIINNGGGGGGSGGGGGGGGGVQDYRLRGELVDSTSADGKVEYRERLRSAGLERRFKVEIEDAPANNNYQVRINGQLVTTITTNGSGFVEFQFRTAQFIDDPGDGIPMPSTFPSLQDGDVVTVGDMTATLSIDD